MTMEGSGFTGGPRGYAFGPFLIDVVRRVAWRDRRVLPLTAKTFDVLVMLLSSRHRIVTKDELLAQLWPGTVVLENTLVRHMSTLRRALGLSKEVHDYIVTIPGQGYRFVAQARELAELPEGLPLSSHVAALTETVAALPSAPIVDDSPGLVSASSPEVQAPQWPRPPWPRTLAHRRYMAVAGLLAGGAMLVAGAALVVGRSGDGEAPPRRIVQRFTFDAGLPRDPSWSPDGHALAYTSDRGGNADIWVQRLDDSTPFRVTSSPAQESQPAWSPNGDWLAFRSERNGGSLYAIQLNGGGERQLAPFGYQPRWSPDGRRILFSSSSLRPGAPGLFVTAISGGPPTRVLGGLTAEFQTLSAAWHPDGRVSIWGLHRSRGWQLVTSTIDGTQGTQSAVAREVGRQFARLGVTFGNFVWSPSGTHVYFEGLSQGVRNLWRITVDPETLEWVGGPDRLTTGAGSDRDIALSPAGNKLAFSVQNERTRVWAFPFDASSGKIVGSGEPVTSGAADELDADAPADGSKFAYRVIRGGRHELWQRTLLDGQEHLLLSSQDWSHTTPRWSPDGAYVAYLRSPVATRAGLVQPAVAILAANGGRERLLNAPSELSFTPKDWSADGSWILGSCRPAPTQPVATCLIRVTSSSPSNSEVRILAADPSRDLYCQRFSPDRRWISFIAVDRNGADTSRVYVVPATGGHWTPITEGDAFEDKPRWAPDGRTLYFVSSRGGVLNIWGRRFDAQAGLPAGDAFQVTSFDGPGKMLSSELRQTTIAVTARRLFLPLTEKLGAVWILQDVDK
jgi:Tol biopolymer transport system component/DNA-binding winged helix-turn-helix (wHTH) protein